MNDANTSSTAFPAPFSYVQHLLIFGLENWAEIRRNPGATEHEDGVEERLARARETEKAMVLLDVLVNYDARQADRRHREHRGQDARA